MTGIGADILGVIAVGVGAAALIYALMHALRKAGVILPRWVLTAGIGLAMVSYSVWNDYAWYGRSVAKLPQGSVVLLSNHTSLPWAPWTFVFPVVTRFTALDPATVERTAPDLRRAEIRLIERRAHTILVRQDFDCANGLIRLPGGDWLQAGEDTAFDTVCGGGNV